MNEKELDFTKFKYVLYARKSTDDPQRQIRSIGDQIAECKEVAIRLGLRLIDPPLVETKSAKKPNQRPVFSQMLRDLKGGKIDGILAWNPDRLARNMKEGGEIIDMIDEGYIKDLKFVTHHFSNDPNGKMLLGLAFVLSKQYSDDLSQKVTRGVRRKFAEGKPSNDKHGYIRDESGLLRPDYKNFDLICDAFKMRLEGTSLEEISKYMNENGYGRLIKRDGRKVDMDPRILSDIFGDPVYYGVLIQANQEVDLRTLYDFIPAISEDDFFRVVELSRRRLKPFNTRRRTTYYPLRLMVKCAFCDQNMVVGPSTSKTGTKYLNFRCDKEYCKRKKKSIRAIKIFSFIYDFLEKNFHFTEKEYSRYYKEVTSLSDDRLVKLKTELHSKEGTLKRVDAEIREISLSILKTGLSKVVKDQGNQRAGELAENKIELQKEIEQIRVKLTDPETNILNVQEFLNLSKNAARIVQSADAIIKDQICRIIFLNFTVDEEKVLMYQLKPPFDELLKQQQLHTGRG